MQRIRIATYNVHKCRGLDRRVRPDRIVSVLRELNAYIIALQEVVSVSGGLGHEHQARYIAEQLEMDFFLGETRKLNGGSYGNVLLTRFSTNATVLPNCAARMAATYPPGPLPMMTRSNRSAMSASHLQQ